MVFIGDHYMAAQTMKVLRMYGAGDLRLDEDPVPTPKAGEALIRVTAVGVCGSDVHWYEDGRIGPTLVTEPLVLGHEFAGVIAEGENAGQRVAVDPNIPCGTCEFCEEGYPNLCQNHYFAGSFPDDGAFCEYVAWPRHCLFPLPEALSDTDGAMLEPVGIAMETVGLGGIQPGMVVGVYGCGPIGLLTIQMAKLAGAAEIIATDKLDHRMEFAQQIGATAVFKANDAGDERVLIKQATRGRGVDVAFEAAGANPAVETAIETARPGATVVLCGIPSHDVTSFGASEARDKGLTIKFVRRMRHTYPRAIRLIERGLIDARSFVSHRFALEDGIEAMLVAQRREGHKVVIDCSVSE